MHYSRHRLSVSLAYLTTVRSHTCQPMASGLVLLAHWLIRQKLNRVSSVQFSFVRAFRPIFSIQQNARNKRNERNARKP